MRPGHSVLRTLAMASSGSSRQPTILQGRSWQDAGLQQMYEQGKGAKDKPNFKSWLEKGDPQRDAQVQARAKELGVSEDEVRRDLETRRVMDFSTPLTQKGHDEQSGVINGLRRGLGIGGFEDSTRLLPNGGLAVNPSLGEDQSKFEQAVNSSSASKEAKEAALKQWPAYHDAWLTKATDTLKASKTLPGIQDYNEWLTSNTAAGHFSEKRPDGSVRQYTDNEKTQLYLDAMKGRSGLRKFMDNVSTSLVAGGGQVVAGVLGAEALARNTFQDITGLDIGGKQVSEAAAAMARQNQALTQAHELTGTIEGTGGRIVSGVAQAVPSVGFTVGTGGAGGAALAFVQGAGSTYNELLQHHLDKGMSPQEAHRAAAGTAIASGAVSAALGKIMPGGAQALNNPATREAAKRSFGTVLKSALKGAAEEIPQEVIDGGFNHIATEMSKGKSFNEAATSYAEQFPQSALTAALLGGGVQAAGDHRTGGQQGGAGKPPAPPSGPDRVDSSAPPPRPGEQSFTVAGVDGPDVPAPKPGAPPEKPGAGMPITPTAAEGGVAPGPEAPSSSGQQIPQDTTKRDRQAPATGGSGQPAAGAPPAAPAATLKDAEKVLGNIERLKEKQKAGKLSLLEQRELAHSENVVALTQVANLEAEQQALRKLPQPRELDPAKAEALEKAREVLKRPWPGGEDTPARASAEKAMPSDTTQRPEPGPPLQTTASDGRPTQTRPASGPEKPASSLDNNGQPPHGTTKISQNATLPSPSTPPLSVADSQKLMENVSKMPPEAQRHPQVQADLEQARQVVAADAASKVRFSALPPSMVIHLVGQQA